LEHLKQQKHTVSVPAPATVSLPQDSVTAINDSDAEVAALRSEVY